MIGNDIIDLAYTVATTDWSRPGVRAKVYTDEEYTSICRSDNPFLLAWRYWSMKESAYKAHVRMTQEVGYYPSRLACHIESDGRGSVSIGRYRHQIQTTYTSDYLHSYVDAVGYGLVTSILDISAKDPLQVSTCCRTRLIEIAAEHYGWSPDTLEVRKDASGLPQLYRQGVDTDLRVSISHHGSYGALVFTA